MLLILAGCAANKKDIAKNDGIFTCQNFYEFVYKVSKNNNLEIESLLKSAEIPISNHHGCDKKITCNEKYYCADWLKQAKIAPDEEKCKTKFEIIELSKSLGLENEKTLCEEMGDKCFCVETVLCDGVPTCIANDHIDLEQHFLSR